MANIRKSTNTAQAGHGNLITFIQIPDGTAEQGVGTSDVFLIEGQVQSVTGLLKATDGVARLRLTCGTKKQIEDDEAIFADWDLADVSSQTVTFSLIPITGIRLVVDSGTARVQITAR